MAAQNDKGLDSSNKGSLPNRAVGMSMRLAFDLGLHLDMTTYIKKGEITQLEADVRAKGAAQVEAPETRYY
jgi:hypothetical protein